MPLTFSRAKPDGTGLEVVITGGMNNPVGLAFGESGESFSKWYVF